MQKQEKVLCRYCGSKVGGMQMGTLRTIFHYATFGIVDSNEEVDRKNAKFFFPHGMSEFDLYEISLNVSKKFKRLSISVDNQFVYGTVRTQSGLNTWDFCLDFNDFGTLTGDYWFKYIENTDSQIPYAYAKELKTALIEYLKQPSNILNREKSNISSNTNRVINGKSQKDSSTRLVIAKCTNCAANLEVDTKQDIAICPYCGANYVIEKASKVVDEKDEFVIKGSELKAYNGSAEDVVIPESITVIGVGAFRGKDIKSVVLPNSIIIIKENAFRDCYKLEKVNIPTSLVEIGVCVFRSCKSLKQITIPSSIEKIGVYAFRDCISLKKINIPSNVKQIAPNAFWGDSDLEIVWPSTWDKCQTIKLQIASQTLSKEIRVFVRSEENMDLITLFYCGRDANGNYFFCERRNFYERFNKEKTIYEMFGVDDVVTHNVQVLFDDLASLLKKANIDKNVIRKVEVPYDGWIPQNNTKYNQHKMLEVILIQLDDSNDIE